MFGRSTHSSGWVCQDSPETTGRATPERTYDFHESTNTWSLGPAMQEPCTNVKAMNNGLSLSITIAYAFIRGYSWWAVMLHASRSNIYEMEEKAEQLL